MGSSRFLQKSERRIFPRVSAGKDGISWKVSTAKGVNQEGSVKEGLEAAIRKPGG